MSESGVVPDECGAGFGGVCAGGCEGQGEAGAAGGVCEFYEGGERGDGEGGGWGCCEFGGEDGELVCGGCVAEVDSGGVGEDVEGFEFVCEFFFLVLVLVFFLVGWDADDGG